MLDFYPALHGIHVAAVLASGAFFVLRGLALERGGRLSEWAMAAPVRFATYGIDTLLLMAATGLMFLVRQFPGVDAWLSVKILLVLAYIALGSVALKRGRTVGLRRLCFAAALLVFGTIIVIARSRDPLGPLAWLA